MDDCGAGIGEFLSTDFCHLEQEQAKFVLVKRSVYRMDEKLLSAERELLPVSFTDPSIRSNQLR